MKPIQRRTLATIASLWLGTLGFAGGGRAQSAPAASGKTYVTSWFGGAVSVVDLQRGTVLSTIPVGVQDHNVFLSPDQKFA